MHRLIVPVLCGSALDHIGIQPLLDAVMLLSAQPGRRAAGRRHQSRRRKKPRSIRKPDAGRAVLRPGLQNPGRQARRFVLRADLLRPAQGQQPGLQSRQGQEGKRRPSFGTSKPTAASRSQRPRPATSWASSARGISVTGDTLCDAERADPAGIDPIPRNGHLDGHRAGKLAGAQEARRRAGDDEAAGSDLPRP